MTIIGETLNFFKKQPVVCVTLVTSLQACLYSNKLKGLGQKRPPGFMEQ